MNVSGARVLLTGASGGLGQAIGRKLHRMGAQLIITGRNEELLAELAEPTNAEIIVADLATAAGLNQLVAACDDVDILIANAGIGSEIALESETPSNIDRVIDTNLRSPMQLATAFVQLKTQQPKPSHVVFVGSLSGLAATPETRLYNATKFGLRGFALALRQDLANTAVGVSIVEPGFIRDAGMFADGGVELPKGVRTRSPQDVADGVVSAITKNRAEVFVAPPELRAAATLAVVAPGLSEKIQARLNTAEMKSTT